MPEDEYHALERFSSSGIKKLMISAQDFWQSSWMNKDGEEIEKESFNVGSAYHKRILEGKAAFDKAYAVRPKCDRRTKEGKAIYANFLAQHPNATEIDEGLKGYIEAAAHRIEHKPHLAQYLKDTKREVTLLWNDPETNVPMKSRLDALRPKLITDLKTFTNANTNIEHTCKSHIFKYGYHVQAAVYREAVKQTGNDDPHEVVFLFQQSGRVNNALPIKFGEDLLLAQKGNDIMRAGIRKFAEMYDKFGTSQWFDNFETLNVTDEWFHLYMLD
jgi:exodeoxyribonuclease VIII